jgi:EDD domain protein, DegV family
VNKVAITTNSACIPAEEARRYSFRLIPFHIIIDGKDYLDPQVDMESLYAQLDKKESIPTSSTPTMEEFLQTWRELSQNTEAILHISMTQAFTGAYNLASQAKEMARENLPKTTIEVIDSRTTGGGLALIVSEAAEAAAQGKTLNEIVELVNNMIPRTTQLSSRDSLFYLDKGGRIFEAKSWAEAESLNSFRAIVEIDASSGGTTKPIARAKTKRQIMEKVVDIVKERVGDKKLHAAILHNKAPDQVEHLREMVLSQFQCDKLYLAEGSATVAVFNGRGLIDFGFCSSEGL